MLWSAPAWTALWIRTENLLFLNYGLRLPGCAYPLPIQSGVRATALHSKFFARAIVDWPVINLRTSLLAALLVAPVVHGNTPESLRAAIEVDLEMEAVLSVEEIECFVFVMME